MGPKTDTLPLLPLLPRSLGFILSAVIFIAAVSIGELTFAQSDAESTARPYVNSVLTPDPNTGTDVDATDGGEAERNLRDLSGTGAPAIVDPLVLSRLLLPGEGIQILALGTRFDQVQLEFGPPLSTKKTGVLGRTRHWMYRADDGTNIILSGHDVVEAISVRGSPSSTFMTIEGVSFGMAVLDITTFYGPAKVSKNGTSYDYPDRGIRFDFVADRVDTITLSPRDN